MMPYMHVIDWVLKVGAKSRLERLQILKGQGGRYCWICGFKGPLGAFEGVLTASHRGERLR